jgi:hypothetical protein
MSSTFTSSANDPINRVICVPPVVTPEELGSELEEVFDVLETASELNKHDFTRVSRMAIL